MRQIFIDRKIIIKKHLFSFLTIFFPKVINIQFMNSINLKNIFLISFIFIALNSFSQKFVNEFLNIGVGAKSHGLFGAVVASVDDGTAAYWNTAGLTNVKSTIQINAMHAKWFGGLANYDYVNVVSKLSGDNNQVAAFSLIRLGIDNIPNTLNLIGADGTLDYDRITNFSAADYAGLFSYARTVGREEKLSLGGNIKVIHRTIGPFGKAWGFGVDLGAQYKFNDQITFGISGRDITTTFNAWSFNLTEEQKNVFINTDNDIPISSSEVTLPRLIIGGAYTHRFNDLLQVRGELNLNISTDGTKAGVISANRFNMDPLIGFEAGYDNTVYLRIGLGNMQRVLNPVNTSQSDFEIQPNAGLGINLGRLKVDYAMANVGNAGSVLVSHIFSASLDIVPKER